MDPHLTQCRQGRGLPAVHTNFDLDPSNAVDTVQQRYRQTGQLSDSIGRTVLQTVAQKSN